MSLRPALLVAFFLKFCSTKSKGTNPIKSNNEMPYVGQEDPNNNPDKQAKRKFFFIN